jgi:hypothetical protein
MADSPYRDRSKSRFRLSGFGAEETKQNATTSMLRGEKNLDTTKPIKEM